MQWGLVMELPPGSKVNLSKTKNSTYMPVPDFYQRIHFDRTKMSNDDIKEAGRLHNFTMEELLAGNYIDQTRFQELTHISSEAHYEQIAIRNPKYTRDVIRQLIQSGQIQENTLLQKRIFSKEQLDDILDRPHDPPPAPPIDELPPVLKNRVDVFLMGVTDSGKSSLLAGLLKAALDSGKYRPQMLLDGDDNVSTRHGLLYADYLIECLEARVPPQRTINDYFTMVPFNLNDNGKEIPISFMEMGGELFQDIYGKTKKDVHKNLQTYFFGDNQKILFCIIDFKQTGENTLSKNQMKHFTWFVNLLDATKSLQRCAALSILITKWDLSPDQSPGAAERFIMSKYLNLYTICQELAKKNRLLFPIITYSLGEFDSRNNIEFDSQDSDKVLDWLTKNTPRLK